MTVPRRRFARERVDVPLQLPRGRGALPQEVVRESQRHRLLGAMTKLAGTKGFAEITVTDLVERAGVSRGAFYTLFTDKTDCYLAAYGRHASVLIESFGKPLHAEPDPVDGLLEAMRTYVRTLGAHPVHARAYLLESVRAGAEALTRRWRTVMAFVEMTHEQCGRIAETHPELEPVTENTVVALIGGVNELACRELDRAGGDGDVAGLEADVVGLTISVLGLDAVLLRAGQGA